MSDYTTWITVATPITVAVLGTVGTIWVKRLSKRQDQAAVRKTNAEAESIEVKTARDLVADIKQMMADQRVEYESKLATTRSELSNVADRQRIVELKQSMLLAALAAHAPWDEAAWATLKAKHPEYPPPPPIDSDGRTLLRGIDPLEDKDDPDD